MLCDLIIDGNYILSRLTFTLHKNNLLYGALTQALENTISSYRKWFPFANIYLASDSKEKSWRKNIVGNYKGTRKKNTDIDWAFVYDTYNDFKSSLTSVKVMEAPTIEGDDWISYLTEKANKEGRSTMVISNDYDIKQVVKFSLEPLYINFMSNEMYNKEKLFLPNEYQVFMSAVKNLPNDNIFELNDDAEFLGMMDRFINKYTIVEVDYYETLIIKLISGDKSDNIGSVWTTYKNGKKRGIGEKGAETIYKLYLDEFGEPNIKDPDLYENLADLICEKKKISKTNMIEIISNIDKNSKLIDLRIENLPREIVRTMNEVFIERN
jgi:5'-3' exonuclease